MAPLLLGKVMPSTSGASWLLAALLLSSARPALAARIPSALYAGGMQLFEDVLGVLDPEDSSQSPGSASGQLAHVMALALSAALARGLRRVGGSSSDEDNAERQARRSPGSLRSALPDLALAEDYEDFMAAASKELNSTDPMQGVDYENQELDFILAGERTTAVAHEYENMMDSEYDRYFDQLLTA
mmetsp:Transcript_58659/g.157057  ORF Transcript_58659/g.157057 Transcript_58659/m.157057 type:complete len:186 (-) Transcript_58659:83-640(-)|eukprot:CAMPEP_0171163366 /NCGR_PEP_ID=MMETSP0790-20130122/5104_1 /TAXON_ID=2925 /ORGANISM="Alexandrium catenella, Strain OF101" /LENGTH=185 /DNA_ID=CAMNT_0011628065 /DNA_START=75 /DNA_END=632 /DNA_ORIENTATION=-